MITYRGGACRRVQLERPFSLIQHNIGFQVNFGGKEFWYTLQHKMPEVIDLIDSSPPPQPSHLQPPPSTQARHSFVRFSSPFHPAVAATTATTAIPASSPNYLSSDFDSSLFTFETPGRSAKKRKLTPQGERSTAALPPAEAQPRVVAKSSTQTVIHSDYSLFTFSDDIDPPGLPPVSRADAGTSTATANTTTLTTTTTSYVGPSTTKTKTYKWDGEESDPIVFTSSAPEPTTAKERLQSKLNKPSVITIDDDFDEIQDWSDPFRVSPEDPLDKHLDDPRPSLKPAYSDRTATLLASLRTDDNAEKKPITTTRLKKSTANFDNLDFDFGEDSLSDVPARPTETSKRRRKPKVDTEEKAAKAREREAIREKRKQEKEAEKERKRIEKEGKAKEKQFAADIAEVNKSKVHKKESMPEMIVDMASTFEGTSVGNQVVEYVKTLGAEHTFFQSSIPNIVKWRRKKKSEYNEDAAQWEPCQPYIATEDHVLCMLPAQEFVDLAICEDGTQTLDGHVQRLKNSYRNCKPIYLIDGLMTWMRRNQNSRNRAYQAEVLAQVNAVNESLEDVSNQSKRKRTKKSKKPEDTPLVADDTIEDALLELQVTHNCLIYHTNAAGETAVWIKNFSEHISTVPYRHVQMGNYDGAAFCMETGQVKTGVDKVDTFVKMLQEINRVTAPMAYGITVQYPSAIDLLHAMKKHGPTLLENVRKSANKNGSLTDSRIGPAVSKRLYKVFMGLDETSADI
jgi:crossover junction endonuclease EME1